MAYLVIDIETILDDELPPQLDPEKFPSPPHHKVICIGAALLSNDYELQKIKCFEGNSEKEILENFTQVCIKLKPCIISFNGRGFDLPVIASRCFKHGIPFKYYYGSRAVRYRYSTEGHFDLMDYLADFGATKTSKLDIIAKLCGMPGKTDVSGKDVANLTLEQTQLYCLSDVIQTVAVFLRLQLTRGIIEKEEYIKKAQEFLIFIADTPTYQLINKEKFLLTTV